MTARAAGGETVDAAGPLETRWQVLSAGQLLNVSTNTDLRAQWPQIGRHLPADELRHIPAEYRTSPGPSVATIPGTVSPGDARRWLNAHLHCLHLNARTLTLHGVAMRHEDRTVVLLGGHGAGKSLVGVALARRGWLAVAGDAVLLNIPPGQAPHVIGGTRAYLVRPWRKARNLTLVALGEAVHTSDDLVRLIETAVRRPSRDFAERCDRVLETCGLLVRLWDIADDEARRQKNQPTQTDNLTAETDTSAVGTARPMTGTTASGMIVVQMRTLSGEVVPVSIDRRTFVASAASLPGLVWIGNDPVSGVKPSTALGDGDLGDVVTTMTHLRTALSAQDNLLGPRAAAPTVIQQLDILQDLSKRATGRSRTTLVAVQAGFAEFAGWLSDDLGDRTAGQYWTDRALQWAHESDDEIAVGYILMRKAQRAIADNDPAAAISLAQAAQRRGALSPRVRAAAAQQESQGHAGLADVAAFRTTIDRARDLVAGAPPHRASERGGWCTTGYVDMHEAAGWLRLGEPDRAVEAYEQGLVDWPSAFRRDEGLYYGRLAEAHAAAGRPEQAAQAGQRALSLAAATGSARIATALRPLPAAFGPWHTLPAVRAFTSDLTAALSPEPA